MTKEMISAMIAKNGAVPYKEDENGEVFIRMTDGYGIATNFSVKNKCPKCGAKLVKIGVHQGCYDGEFTHTDNFTCENKCILYFQDIRGRG
ncbi:MAG: hypothetical protein LBB89_06465 [Treponema sp.]|jgi:hypothetical protein|nr:hypothetical protein [Treponema sp.]